MKAIEEKDKVGTVILGVLEKYGSLVALIVFIFIFEALEPRYFLTIKNLLNILQQAALFGIAAIGLTYPLAMKNFDLSVGYIGSLAGVFVIKMFVWGFSEFSAILITIILVGALSGIINGSIVAAKVPSLVATIGTGFLYFGITMSITGGGRLFYDIPTHFGVWGIQPISLYITFSILVFSYFILQKTGIGRYIYAIGNNEQASFLAGVNINAVKLFTFVICDILASVAGIMLSSQVMCGDPVGANRYLMQGLAAAYIGTSIFKRGEANVFGTFIGILIISVAYNGMTLIGIYYSFREVITGVILIAAMVANSLEKK